MVEPDVFLESIYEEVLDIGMAASPVRDENRTVSISLLRELMRQGRKDGKDIWTGALPGDWKPGFTFAGLGFKDKNIIVLGCGAGHWVFYIKFDGANSVTGVDIDKNSILVAEKISGYIDDSQIKKTICGDGRLDIKRAIVLEQSSRPLIEHREINFVVSDAAELDTNIFKDNSFDIVIAIHLMPYITGDKQKAVALQMARLVQPGGYIYTVPSFVCPNGEDEDGGFTIYTKDKGMVRGAWSIQELLEEAVQEYGNKNLTVVYEDNFRIWCVVNENSEESSLNSGNHRKPVASPVNGERSGSSAKDDRAQFNCLIEGFKRLAIAHFLAKSPLESNPCMSGKPLRLWIDVCTACEQLRKQLSEKYSIVSDLKDLGIVNFFQWEKQITQKEISTCLLVADYEGDTVWYQRSLWLQKIVIMDKFVNAANQFVVGLNKQGYFEKCRNEEVWKFVTSENYLLGQFFKPLTWEVINRTPSLLQFTDVIVRNSSALPVRDER
jgi:ubiquinone/menaquinone biosynthesis C-methylase UbiE